MDEATVRQMMNQIEHAGTISWWALGLAALAVIVASISWLVVGYKFQPLVDGFSELKMAVNKLTDSRSEQPCTAHTLLLEELKRRQDKADEHIGRLYERDRLMKGKE